MKQIIPFQAMMRAKILELIESPSWGLVNMMNAMLFIITLRLAGDYIDTETMQVFSLTVGVNLWVVLHLQRGYEHSAWTLFYYKTEHVLDDYYTAPYHPMVWVLAIYADAALVGVITGLPVIVFLAFLGLHIPSIGVLIFCMAVIILAVGCFMGLAVFAMLWAQKWDHLSRIDMVFLTPLFLLSGTFFKRESLLPEWQFLLDYNPLYNLLKTIKGAYFLGQVDMTIFAWLVPLTLISLWVGYRLIASGWRIKQ